ncbi:MULE transposase N-terminal all-beta domain [Arabidopsis thaliana x Arabidopsis arenosa]|uniref:MULE transposase N-terminal all-beta domain n=1 Tax=Arabidopsis thaliana x Arabidopsis arenosa TaxID=1240361 RepID=A0A8T2AY04_9BRAS|nr:MULE transposase N-terminal all-beta domain [Arabidopsis thaliana x Arabidopsis arenosa]
MNKSKGEVSYVKMVEKICRKKKVDEDVVSYYEDVSEDGFRSVLHVEVTNNVEQNQATDENEGFDQILREDLVRGYVANNEDNPLVGGADDSGGGVLAMYVGEPSQQYPAVVENEDRDVEENASGTILWEDEIVVTKGQEFRSKEAIQNYPGKLTIPPPKDLINLVQRRFGVQVSYSTAWRGKKEAANDISGTPEEGFRLVHSYMYMIEKMNHGLWSNDMIMDELVAEDALEHIAKEELIEQGTAAKEKELEHTTKEEALITPTGPMTRFKAKKFIQAIGGLLVNIQEQSDNLEKLGERAIPIEFNNVRVTQLYSFSLVEFCPNGFSQQGF